MHSDLICIPFLNLLTYRKSGRELKEIKITKHGLKELPSVQFHYVLINFSFNQINLFIFF